MSEHQTCSQDRFTSHKEAHLFGIFSDTVCRYKRQASIDLKSSLKQTIFSSSEIDSQLHNNEELSEKNTSTSLKSRLSIMTSQDNNNQDNSNQDNSDDQNNDNQQSSSQNSTLTEH